MQLDKELMFSETQALATAASTNVLDLKDCGDDLSRKLNVMAKIEGGTVADGVSLAAKLETSADNANWDTLVTYPTVTLATLNDTGVLVAPQPLPSGIKRYVRLSYVATLDGGTPFSGDGYIVAGLTPSLDKSL